MPTLCNLTGGFYVYYNIVFNINKLNNLTMKKILIVLFTFLVFGCDKTYVTEIRTEQHNFSYMYFNQYDFDGAVGTASDVIVVNADNILNQNSGARQTAGTGEFEEDFDNYIDDFGNPITVDDKYLSDNCWGRGDFSVVDKDVTGDGMTEQVLGGTLINEGGDSNSIQFHSRPFNVTGDIIIKLEDLLVETNETIKMEVFATWENGTPYGDGNPIYSAEIVNGLNIQPPDDVKGFYSIDIEVPEPLYYVRFQFVFTVIDTDGEPSGIWIDGFHVEGQNDLNDGGCGYNSLPIEITEFSAIKDDDDDNIINVYVETATEHIADYMEFYGSKDGKEWKTIENRIPCDNSSMGSKYRLQYNIRTGKLIRLN